MPIIKYTGDTNLIKSKLKSLLSGQLPGNVLSGINKSYGNAQQGLQSSLAESGLQGTAGGYNASATLDTGRFNAVQNATTKAQETALPMLMNQNQSDRSYDFNVQGANYQQLQDKDHKKYQTYSNYLIYSSSSSVAASNLASK